MEEQSPKRSFFTPKNIILILVGILIVASVPVWFFQTNPPVLNEPAWDSPQTRELAKRACFDCHSNETVWTWYSRVAPFSYPITHHVVDGRKELNFSEWGVAPQQGQTDRSFFAPSIALANGDEDEEGEEHEGGGGGISGELIEEIVEGEMPLPSYLILHPEADLTAAEQQALIDGFRATFR